MILLVGWYSIHCPLEIEVCLAGIVKRSNSDFVHSWDSWCTKGHSYFQKENFSLGFFCCGDVFAFLPWGELILVPCPFLFIAFLPAPDCACNELWEGRPRACFVRLWTAVLKLSPSRTSWTTVTPVCKAFFPITLAPCWRWGTAQRNRPLNMDR